ncbi:universal stress protein [Jiella sp. MQZ9-1]|uniref:Universal stress protein n=1 Tax=Jiella flava TaxID=2816857 RepID=A0A939FYU7_9HYPH|nr:universal stress protein [Jiella flava]MBO0661859.1 universal stress protein [Jiella flava]MCD2470499.1 universal stress protein [Jiella flava]
MTKIMACVDGSIYATSVTDHAVWAARRLKAPVEVVHAIGRREAAGGIFDLSGNLDLGERSTLMNELAELDEKRSKIALKRGRVVLEEAVARVKAAGIEAVSEKLRHGDIADTVADLADETRLTVIGKRGEAADFSKGHLGSNLERVARSTKRPLLVTSRAFRPIETFLVAFDGGKSSSEVVERLVASPLLKDVRCELFMVGQPSGDAGKRLHDAEQRLHTAGYNVSVYTTEGDVEACIANKVEQDGIDLIVMGAYGHSRIRSFIVGSTTAEIIRHCAIPALIIR